MRLLEIVANLEPRLREALSAITVQYQQGQPSATLNFALFIPATGGVNEVDLPEGVSVSGFNRWPDRTHPLDETTPIGEQIEALQASGLVGSLDAVRMDRGSEGVQAGYSRYVWHIKTHAGSQAERNEWLRRLMKRGGR